MAKQARTAPARETYYRFPVAPRIEHILLILSFGTLAITGLAQKFSGNPVGEGVIWLLGGIETTRIIHRVAAIMFAVETIYHIIVLAHKIFVQHIEMTMLPGLQDIVDALDAVRYNLGLAKEPPKMPRYNFAEKAEYWALIWGAIVMGLTGFLLWNPILAAKILPGQIIPAAKAAHGAEAILAVLAIFVWHFYSVHIKTFNKAMFTGKMSRHQMEDEHGQELEQLLSGKRRPPADPAGVRRRERVFIPVAAISALVMVVAVYLVVTIEDTAVSAAPPPPDRVVAFAPVTPTPAPTVTVDNTTLGTAISHPVEGREQCDTCHGPDGMSPWPADHAGRPNESCLICHKPGPSTAGGGTGEARAIPHPIDEGRYADCATCHDADGMKPYPPNHADYTTDACTMCHEAAPATPATPEAGGSAVTGAAPEIAHSIEGDAYKDCIMCHGVGAPQAFPDNHTSYTNDSCTMCHQPQAAAAEPAGVSAGAIPHTIEGEIYKDCTTCHGADGMKPYPPNHADYTTDACTMCHQPQAAAAEPAGVSAGAIPHEIEGEIYKDCTTCHGADGMKPYPPNHADYTTDACTMCHQVASAEPAAPEAGGSAVTGPAPEIAHSIEKDAYKNCLACHGLGNLQAFPDNHASFAPDSCTTCHQPAAE